MDQKTKRRINKFLIVNIPFAILFFILLFWTEWMGKFASVLAIIALTVFWVWVYFDEKSDAKSNQTG